MKLGQAMYSLYVENLSIDSEYHAAASSIWRTIELSVFSRARRFSSISGCVWESFVIIHFLRGISFISREVEGFCQFVFDKPARFSFQLVRAPDLLRHRNKIIGERDRPICSSAGVGVCCLVSTILSIRVPKFNHTNWLVWFSCEFLKV